MPKHRHDVKNKGTGAPVGITSNSGSDTPEWCFADNLTTMRYLLTTDYVGGGSSHNHGFTGSPKDISVLQPYLSVFMWKRTA